ncbi:hypothetical protein [Providencia rustigianii]|uniref:Uncharacterized protein n=1 Tax=Providencia rustigianii DSM 4541 TaxID=500637 RepID=D1P836_9GAMM|nr:hypothetical protein [Providencia rustigianii]EFB70479.1 hypothetical protein PROVRUST_08417 [Providencia rustigianii DSM 4541]MBP6436078.1 hypothetical protein [Paludibacteraceae bacterium]
MNVAKSMYGIILFLPCIFIYCFYVCFSGLADITKISYQYLITEIVVEQYMSEAQIGRLVKKYMVETSGMSLKIVFPEYDRGE